ncbi:CaiB/BaiF CoA-transferase family protein [Ruegeria sp. HKCCD8929]|uniref:CaiB/BaiF CoA transferase family protein n=1 Tax=Ruegeria sp. HKCCD8929 TaxID=2683006 RepID=UPI001488C7D7|nr:CoA transferase [Ruegeria sp. HKCCD8929]
MYDLLGGARILDLTSVVLGPYATQFLGDFGADVVKVEPVSGDIFRYVRPGKSETMGAGFLNLNRNKKSVVLDLKSVDGRQKFDELLGGADAVVHNMRTSAAKRLGIDYESLKQLNSSLVYCSAPGYGETGRGNDLPAYDDIIQAASGIAHLNANADGEPRFMPTIICDKVGGLHLAIAVLAGLVRRANTGKGCFIEAPMFESVVSFLMAEQLAGHTFQPPIGGLGYDRLLSPHRKPFQTKDGHIGVLPYNTQHWSRFLRFVGRDDLAEAEWVQDSTMRSERVGELYEVISEKMPEQTTDEWLQCFKKLDIPCSTVNKLSDLLNNGHLQDVGFFKNFEHPTEGNLRSARSPFRVLAADEKPDRSAPSLGSENGVVSWSAR